MQGKYKDNMSAHVTSVIRCACVCRLTSTHWIEVWLLIYSSSSSSSERGRLALLLPAPAAGPPPEVVAFWAVLLLSNARLRGAILWVCGCYDVLVIYIPESKQKRDALSFFLSSVLLASSPSILTVSTSTMADDLDTAQLNKVGGMAFTLHALLVSVCWLAALCSVYSPRWCLLPHALSYLSRCFWQPFQKVINEEYKVRSELVQYDEDDGDSTPTDLYTCITFVNKRGLSIPFDTWTRSINLSILPVIA